MSRRKRREADQRGRQPTVSLGLKLAFAATLLAAASLGVWRLGALRISGAPPGGSSASRPDNVLLVTLDTTRADRLGCYGHAAAKTPHLDRLAEEGTRFETVIAPAPITLPSHASLFTGLYPFEHGVRNNGNFYLSERFETITTRLKSRGYRTGAFVGSFILDRRYGLARGFDVYDDRMEGAQAQVLVLEAERRGDRTALALGAWLDERAREPATPFFAWLHIYDPHEPYRPPQPFRERFAADPYDGEIAFANAIVASVLDRMRPLGLLDGTLVVVTADHGESLGDHGEETHSMLVYEAAIRVPLILWRPGRVPAGRVVTEPVRLTDVAPTLLELLGATPPVLPHSRSLVPLLERRGSGQAPLAYAETLLPKFYMNWAPLRALRDGRYKLIDAPRPELYDLAEDPAEARNLYAAEPRKARALREALDALAASGDAMSVQSLDREAMEKLAALGYIGAGSESHAAASEPHAGDPKDFIAVFNRLRRANSAVRERRFEDALPMLQAALAEDPKNAFAQLVLGSAYMGMGDFANAIAQYRKYVALVPTSSYAHQWMAICYLNVGDRGAALREAEAALALDPRFTDARVLRAGVLASRGQHETAIQELKTAAAMDPAKPSPRLDLAKVLAEAGRTDEARIEYEMLVQAQPEFVPALVGLAVLDATGGQLISAERRLRRALEVDGRQSDARFNLARVLERQGRAGEAREEYDRLAASADAPPGLRSAAQRRLAALKTKKGGT